MWLKYAIIKNRNITLLILVKNYMRALEIYGPLTGRILLSLIFILSGFAKVTNFTGSVQFAATGVGESLATLAIIVAIAVELGGGLMLLFGFKIRWAALAVAGYTLLAALLYHFDFANQAQMTNFMKNLAIAGGLLFVAIYGAGPFSVDSKRKTVPIE